MRQLRGNHPVTPAVTPESLAVTQVTRLRHVSGCSQARAHETSGNLQFSRERHKTTCNRVTHVTTGLSGVTVCVTNTFSRNHKGFEVMSDEREKKAAWVKANLPTCAAVAASFKEAFCDVRMVYASENGHSIGQRGPDGVKLSETVVGSMALAPAAKGRR